MKTRIKKDLTYFAKKPVRLGYTKEEDWAHRYLRLQGFSYRVDRQGNTFLTVKGRKKKKIIIGSHLDTVKTPGLYDGTVGVVLGLEVLRQIEDPEYTIEVVAWRCEESTRFNKSCMGSRSMAAGLKKKTLFYLEPHIEQGPVLWDKKIPFGVVKDLAAAVRYKFVVKGAYAHSGTTPPAYRKDALLAASKMIQKKNKATVGCLSVLNESINTVPGEVEFKLDLRDNNLERRNRIEKKILGDFRDIASQEGVVLKYTVIKEQN